MNKYSELVNKYAEIKHINKEYEDEIKRLNTKIKSIMVEYDTNVLEGTNFDVTLRKSEKVTMNEDKLLNMLNHSSCDIGDIFDRIVKTKQYIDYDELEKLLYKGEIPSELIENISKCKEVKHINSLIVKQKGKKDDECS